MGKFYIRKADANNQTKSSNSLTPAIDALFMGHYVSRRGESSANFEVKYFRDKNIISTPISCFLVHFEGKWNKQAIVSSLFCVILCNSFIPNMKFQPNSNAGLVVVAL